MPSQREATGTTAGTFGFSDAVFFVVLESADLASVPSFASSSSNVSLSPNKPTGGSNGMACGIINAGLVYDTGGFGPGPLPDELRSRIWPVRPVSSAVVIGTPYTVLLKLPNVPEPSTFPFGLENVARDRPGVPAGTITGAVLKNTWPPTT